MQSELNAFVDTVTLRICGAVFDASILLRWNSFGRKSTRLAPPGLESAVAACFFRTKVSTWETGRLSHCYNRLIPKVALSNPRKN